LESQWPFLIALHSGSDFAEFRAIRHGCLSIRLFTSCDSYQLVMTHLVKSGKLRLQDVKEAEKELKRLQGKEKAQ
jgi:hypothetical protein